ncbi:histone-lysine N-methyltransferase PRDM9-like isoform X2 [Sardina pilchardus]|uniref:histone-lysine N-methyltransferase PRDM9-like isoform X2 n=1 Tax=Sardina pilchardus TaxID=27697 RepID=UPI002E13D0C8
MAEAATKPKKAKALSEEAKKRKRERDNIRARAKIHIGPALARWRQLKDEEGCPTDADLAVLLLDSHIGADEIVVQLECLLQLFQRCFECCSACSIRKRREGRVLNVTQNCQQCQANRKWRSHEPEQTIRDPASNQEVVEETVLLSFGGSDTETDEEVVDRIRVTESEEKDEVQVQDALCREEDEEVRGLHHANSSKDSCHMKIEKVVEETVLLSFGDSESDDEEVKYRNLLSQSEEDQINQSEEEVKGHHPPNQTFVDEGSLADTSENLGHTRVEKVNNFVIHTPGASNNRLNDQEEGDKNDSHSSVSGDEMIVYRIEEEMEHEDEVADLEEDYMEGQDSVDDDWYPSCEEVEQSSASEDKNSDAEFVPRAFRKSKRGFNPDAEPILPLVWCSVCRSRFKHSCFRQCHSRLYGCFQCGIKPKKIDTSDANKEVTPTNNGETTNNCVQESISSRNQDTCSDQGTIGCNNQDMSNDANQGPGCGSKQWTATDGNQDDSGSSQGVTTTGGLLVAATNKVRRPGASYIDIQGLYDTAANENTHEESSSLNTETFPDVHSQAVHIEDLAVHFESLTAFQSHALKCHGIRPPRKLCVDCGKFITMVNMVDGGPSHICEYKVKPIVCPNCGKRFATEIGLQTHINRIHNEKYILTCRYCLKAFKSPEDKGEHEESHVEELLKYHCPHCSLRFADRPSWCAHRKSHWPNGKHICEVCSKGFHSPCVLIRHMAVHTGQRPYSCKLCDRSFNQPSHLKSHMRLHTGEKPFKCQDCGECFNHNVSLKNHIQRHHGPGAEEGNSRKGAKGGKGRMRRKKRNS